MDFVKQSLDTIKGGNNIEQLLRQAEEMLNEIKSGDFSLSESAAKEELEKATESKGRIS